MNLKSLAVFCGSHQSDNPTYQAAAEALAEELTKNNIRLVYGGACVGLMGQLADAMLSHQGDVVGVMPYFLIEGERVHQNLTKLYQVNSMSERKDKMAELSDGFILLPGGGGSLDEFFEMFTYFQLGLHRKPCAILNVNGYFDSLITFLQHSVKEGFLKDAHVKSIHISESAELLVKAMAKYP
jgi:uncharacterized protein (TIGR00730 family)